MVLTVYVLDSQLEMMLHKFTVEMSFRTVNSSSARGHSDTPSQSNPNVGFHPVY